jgi:hypothetical protein
VKSKTTVGALAPVLYLVAFTVAQAAPVSASLYLCGPTPPEKDLLTLNKGQTFDMTDITVANGSSGARLVAVVQGTWPQPAAAPSQFAALIGGGATFTQQFKTPITYRGGSAVRAKTICAGDNLAVYVTVSGDLH